MIKFLKSQSSSLGGLLFGALITFGVGVGCQVPLIHLLKIIAVSTVGAIIILIFTG